MATLRASSSWSISTIRGTVYSFKVTSGHCPEGKTEKVDCSPMPEVPINIDMTLGNLGLTDQEESQIVTFLQALTDGFTAPYPDINTFTGQCMTGGNASTQGNEFLIPAPSLPPSHPRSVVSNRYPRRTLFPKTTGDVLVSRGARPRGADGRLQPVALRSCNRGGRKGNSCPCRNVGGVNPVCLQRSVARQRALRVPHKPAISSHYTHGRHGRRRCRTRSRREEGLMR